MRKLNEPQEQIGVLRRYWKLWVGLACLLAIVVSAAFIAYQNFPQSFDDYRPRRAQIPTGLQSDPEFDPPALYLTWQNDPASTMTICWQTVEGTRADTEAETAPAVQIAYQKFDDTEWYLKDGISNVMPHSPRTTHFVELTGLEPATNYRFRFGEQSRIYTFRTMPAQLGRPLRFVVGGDTMHSREWFEQINRLVTARDPEFIVIGGDLAYADGNPKKIYRWYEFLEACKSTLITEQGRIIPLVATIGNHEVRGGHGGTPEEAPFFYHLFPFPQRGYDALDFGDYLSLLLLNTGHTAPVTGEQTIWLAQTLAERESVPHIFPVYHVPAYPSVRSPESHVNREVRQYWSPLFEKFGVRIAFENDDHTYKRTHPIRGEKRVPKGEGVTYLGDGAWGVRERQPQSNRWYLAKSAAQRHFILVTLNGLRQEFEMIDHRNRVIDRYQTVAIPR